MRATGLFISCRSSFLKFASFWFKTTVLQLLILIKLHRDYWFTFIENNHRYKFFLKIIKKKLRYYKLFTSLFLVTHWNAHQSKIVLHCLDFPIFSLKIEIALSNKRCSGFTLKNSSASSTLTWLPIVSTFLCELFYILFIIFDKKKHHINRLQISK